MKLAIIGHGFVGQAVDHGFSKPSVEKFYVDPKYNTTVEDLVAFDPDLIFIAVPTPMGPDRKINPEILLNVMNDLDVFGLGNKLIALKSTVTPDIVGVLAENYPNFVYNPEFLTERNFKEDFVHPPMHIFGALNRSAAQNLHYYYTSFSICEPAPVHYVDPKAASLVKYTINSFLATKVIFFNFMKEILDNSGTTNSYADFINMLKCDPRMGLSHFNVPGPDGEFGYGGTCFPKDTNALYKYSEIIEAPHELLDDVTVYNEYFRGSE